jgi:aspartate carbamoyltransferase regulatory subunit
VVNKYTFDDPTLPRMNLPCQNDTCVSNTDKEIESEILYVRFNDQDMRYMYLCEHCRQCWCLNKKNQTEVLFDFSDDTKETVEPATE